MLPTWASTARSTSSSLVSTPLYVVCTGRDRCQQTGRTTRPYGLHASAALQPMHACMAPPKSASSNHVSVHAVQRLPHSGIYAYRSVHALAPSSTVSRSIDRRHMHEMHAYPAGDRSFCFIFLFFFFARESIIVTCVLCSGKI